MNNEHDAILTKRTDWSFLMAYWNHCLFYERKSRVRTN